jgi:hypothetical protein
MDYNQLVQLAIGLLTPIVVKWITDRAIIWKPQLTARKILFLVVPFLSASIVAISHVITDLSPAWYWQFVLGIASIALNEMLQKFKEADPIGVGARRALKLFAKKAAQTVAIVCIFLGLSQSAQAQAWDYFFHPRPPLTASALLKASPISQSVWMFKPTVNLSLTEIRAGANGGSTQSNFLNAVGMGLTFQRTTYDETGLNYADYSGTVAFLGSGTTNDAPVFTPRVAILFGILNNFINFGPSYDLIQHTDQTSRWAFLLSIGVNLTNN